MSDAEELRDRLYLLAPGFEADGRREYCPECAEAWGLISYFPALREDVTIVHQPLAHPRPGLVSALGEGRWNCPTLVLAAASPDGPPGLVKRAGPARYLDSARTIGAYLAARYGLPHPRGS